MKYRHAFHAGNFADVHKHVTLVALFESLLRKDKGFLLVDTHAGSGIHDLGSAEARQSNEAALGIERLLQDTQSANTPDIEQYLELHEHKGLLRFKIQRCIGCGFVLLCK